LQAPLDRANGCSQVKRSFARREIVPSTIPPVRQQEKLVNKLDGMLAETLHLETIYQQKLDRLAELKQTVLQKAFAGELTAQPEKNLEEAVA
jgi:type I restriction enzyme, S subunit